MHAGLPAPEQGAPLLPGPTLAAPYHLAGPADASVYGYARYTNPSWTLLEAAIGALEGGEAVVFGSGMAAMTAVLMGRLGDGDAIVAPSDGYPGVRWLASERLQPHGVEVRFTRSDTAEVVDAVAGASIVWVETPSNPRLDIVDIPAVAQACATHGAMLVVDNSLATPLGQRPLELGADVSMGAATKTMSGHSDLLLGYVAVRDPRPAEHLRSWRGQTGAIAGPFEAWLCHRSLATLDLRLERSSANALAIARMLAARSEVLEVLHPGLADHPGSGVASRQMRRFGPLVCFTLASGEAADRFLRSCDLVAEATSFGGVHTTAERRARWGTDDVPDGFIRLSAGCEDTDDLLADVASALDLAR